MEAMLDRGLKALDLSLSEDMQHSLLRFIGLLTKWNRVYNLTSVRKPQDMIGRHVLDSLAVLHYVHGPRVLDVGTGAGLPGIPLAVARPDWQFVLLDSSGKKTRFVQQAVADLGLDNVEVVHTRLEAYGPEQPFDTVVTRAFSSLGDIYREAARLCSPEGLILAMKGVYPVAEMEALADRSVVHKVIPLHVPDLDAQRHLVIMAPHPA